MGHAGRASGEKAIARELVLKVAMHCRCEGCTPKVRSAVNNLALAPGVLAVLERSATDDTEEVRLLATADPERLRESLHKATGKKKVDLVLIPPKPNKQERSGRGGNDKEDPRPVDFATVQGLLADPQLHDQGPPPGQPWHGSSYVEGYPPPVPSYYPGPAAPCLGTVRAPFYDGGGSTWPLRAQRAVVARRPQQMISGAADRSQT